MSHIRNDFRDDDSEYVTKTQTGCFQCSRRRIICDRSEPSCGKCIKKGIECSGLGRIRFAEGVARRGRLKGCVIPVEDSIVQGEVNLPGKAPYTEVQWKSDGKQSRRSKNSSSSANSSPPILKDHTSPPQTQNDSLRRAVILDTNILSEDDDDDVIDIVREGGSVVPRHASYPDLQPWIAPLSSEARMLFSYCKMTTSSEMWMLTGRSVSEVVAPVMVVLDTIPNGYRDLFLPMAIENDVLRRAIGVVAAQHLGRERPEMRIAAETGRSAIISRLRRESLYGSAEQIFSKYTWATLIVLLVGETVTGSEDYSFLVQMLLCLSNNSSAKNDHSDATRFLQSQTKM